MLEIKIVPVTPFGQNARLLICSETRKAVVVDPGGDADIILSEMEKTGADFQEIWLTHCHLDHCGGVAPLLRAKKFLVRAHADEKWLRENVQQSALMFGLPANLLENCPEPDEYIETPGRLSVGNCEAEVRFTPGHSPGHVVFYFEKEGVLIAGDTVFAGSIGRTDLPQGDYRTLIESIRSEIMTLPPETVIMPGHGPNTTVGVEMRSNPFLN